MTRPFSLDGSIDGSGKASLSQPEDPRARAARWLFVFYKRALSPALHTFALTQCKHLPTCSEYAYVAVVRHGWCRGGWLALRRVSRCHPLAEGGADPVP